MITSLWSYNATQEWQRCMHASRFDLDRSPSVLQLPPPPFLAPLFTFDGRAMHHAHCTVPWQPGLQRFCNGGAACALVTCYQGYGETLHWLLHWSTVQFIPGEDPSSVPANQSLPSWRGFLLFDLSARPTIEWAAVSSTLFTSVSDTTFFFFC
jgi:hypothetical protein